MAIIMKIKKCYVYVFATLIIVAIGICCFMFAKRTIYSKEDAFAMDTYVNFQVWGEGDEAKNSREIVSELDKQFSMYNDDTSSIATINRSAGQPVKTSSEIIDIVNESNALSNKYSNAVDITSGSLTKLWGISTDSPYLPTKEETLEAVSHIDYSKISINEDKITLPKGTEIDLGSVAKGYACDKLKELYDKGNISCAIASMGSSSLLYGTKPDKSKFNVEIKNPDGGEALGIIKTGETFLSTSGGYERFFEVDGVKYSHIFNLKTGFPAKSDITSVTVLCDSGIESDFLSTLIFIDDIKGLKNHLNAEHYKIVVATSDKKIYTSKGIDFNLNENSGYIKGDLQ